MPTSPQNFKVHLRVPRKSLHAHLPNLLAILLLAGLVHNSQAQEVDARSITEALTSPAQPTTATDIDDDDVSGSFRAMKPDPVKEQCEPRPARFGASDSSGDRAFRNLIELPVAQINLTVEFDSGQSTLTAQGQVQLDEAAKALNGTALTNVSFAVVGHTDRVGTAAANQKLSCDRALSAKAYLVGAGIAPDRLMTLGKGYRELLNRQNPTAAENRRVQFRRLSTTSGTP